MTALDDENYRCWWWSHGGPFPLVGQTSHGDRLYEYPDSECGFKGFESHFDPACTAMARMTADGQDLDN